MTEHTEGVYLTTRELAGRWRTTDKGLAQLRHRGGCPPATRIGGRNLYALEDVVAFEQARRERNGAGAA